MGYKTPEDRLKKDKVPYPEKPKTPQIDRPNKFQDYFGKKREILIDAETNEHKKIVEIAKSLRCISELTRVSEEVFIGDCLAFGFVGVTSMEKYIGASFTSKRNIKTYNQDLKSKWRGWQKSNNYDFFMQSWPPRTNLNIIAKEIVVVNRHLGMAPEMIIERNGHLNSNCPWFVPT